MVTGYQWSDGPNLLASSKKKVLESWWSGLLRSVGVHPTGDPQAGTLVVSDLVVNVPGLVGLEGVAPATQFGEKI